MVYMAEKKGQKNVALGEDLAQRVNDLIQKIGDRTIGPTIIVREALNRFFRLGEREIVESLYEAKKLNALNRVAAEAEQAAVEQVEDDAEDVHKPKRRSRAS